MTALEDMVRDALARNYARFFGFELVEAREGAVTLALPHRAEFEHAPGFFEGTVVTAIGEICGAFSTFDVERRGWSTVTLEQSIQFIGPAHGERLVGEGRILRKGRKVSFASADIFVEKAGERRQCARLSLTQLHQEPK